MTERPPAHDQTPAADSVKTPRLRFPKKARLVHAGQFAAVQKRGERPVRDGVLKIGYRIREDEEPARLGLAVGRRLGKAPRRNRIKRVLRDAFRQSPGRFPPGLDLVVIPIHSERATQWERIDASLAALADKIRRRLQPSDGAAS